MGYVPEIKPIIDTAVKQIIPGLRKHAIDAVVISGGCELSHQSAGLVQRQIEAAGIPTVAITVCRDITYQLQVPRAAALRFPMGNPFGSSMDSAMQSRILRDALSLLHSAQTPGEVSNLDYAWIKT
jgi:D-proline reductase (dithiol) PrdB